MKKIILLFIFSISCFTMNAQSVTISPTGDINSLATSPEIILTSTGVPEFRARRSGGSLTVPTAISDGSSILQLNGQGHNGTSFTNDRARIRFTTAENWTTTANGTYMQFYTTENGTQSILERMRITNEGRVAIGLTNPGTTFEVASPNAVTGINVSKTGGGFGSGRLSLWSDRNAANEWRPGYMESGDNGSFTGRLDFFTNGTGSGNKIGSVLGMSVVNGKVGVGLNDPATTLHVATGGMTIDHDNSATDRINFKLNNPIASAGMFFNSAAGLNLGGLAHQQTRTQLWRGSNSNLGLTINLDNYIGLNNASPGVPFHINYGNASTSSTTGAMIIGTLADRHLTFDNNEMNAYNGTGGSELVLQEESGGDVYIGGTNPINNSDLRVNGFTKLGGGTAPNIKMIELSGTTGSTQGGNDQITHGLTPGDILDISVIVQAGTTYHVVPNYTEFSGYEFQFDFTSTLVRVFNDPTNSVNILSRPYRVLITYKE